MTADPDDRLWVTILAGGIGSRFWPVSTPSRPKQLLPLVSERPLIVDTWERARSLAPVERIRLLAGEALVEPFRSVLRDLAPDSVMVEPAARGTAPVLAWAAWTLLRRDPDAVMVSLHADHLVDPIDGFKATVRAAARIADRERALVAVGVHPDRAETGYGYIQPGERITAADADRDASSGRRRADGAATGEAGRIEASHIRAFHEKPDETTATNYVERGYLWNSGIFVWRADVFLDEVAGHAPDLHAALGHLERDDVEGFFEAAPPGTVDVVVMEATRNAVVVPALFEWDDVGAWHALHRTRDGDADDNVVIGEGAVREGYGNVVYAEDGRVVLFGVDDLVVVRTDEVTLVTRRGRSAELKGLLDLLPPSFQTPEQGDV